MKQYKVVIPSVGIGSRVGPYTKFLNKALLTIGNKPAICHIIDKFPKNIEIVVLLGYKGDYIYQVLTEVYPDRKFDFVFVDKYEGPGSGLGYSLLQGKHLLQCPFIFITNDSIIDQKFSINLDPNAFGNWAGWVSKKTYNNLDEAAYRTLTINEDGYVININPKGISTNNIYIGICGIFDYELFWKTMETDPIAIDSGESFGLNALNNITAIYFAKYWYDTGNISSLKETQALFSSNEHNILEKENEAIWFIDNRVIKFSTDEQFISNRCKRLDLMDSKSRKLFPKISKKTKNLYIYEKEPGVILSDCITRHSFSTLFNTMLSNIWDNNNKTYKDEDINTDELIETIYDFYEHKTYKRINHFKQRFEFIDAHHIINDVQTPTVIEQLDSIDWKFLCEEQVTISGYHGDFHNENIIIKQDGSFKLLDWRQNFGSSLMQGDIYYDFAKFYHGLLVPHRSIINNQFQIKQYSEHQVFIDILRPLRFSEVELDLFNWLNDHNYNAKKVKILTALIFLNICGLHDYPYSLFLFFLGKYLLQVWK